MEDFSQFAPVSDSSESFDQFEKIGDTSEDFSQFAPVSDLPEVSPDTKSDYTFVGFANPTTLPKAQRVAEQVMSEQEPGYWSSALNYAMGENQENPNWLGQYIKGVNTGANRMVQRPFESAAIVGSSLLPTSWPLLAQVGTTGIATGLGNLSDQAVAGGDISTGEAIGSGIGSGIGAGLGYGVAKAASGFARPILDKLAQYREALAVRTSRLAKAEMDKLARDSDMELTKLLSREKGHRLGDPVTEDEILGELYGATPEQIALQSQNREVADVLAQREHLDAIKKYMMENNPNRYSEFADVYTPTDKEALDFYLSAKEPIQIPAEIPHPTLTSPDALKFLADLPFSKAAAIRPLVGGKVDLTGTIGRNLLEPTAKALTNPTLGNSSRLISFGLGLPYVSEKGGEVGSSLERLYNLAK